MTKQALIKYLSDEIERYNKLSEARRVGTTNLDIKYSGVSFGLDPALVKAKDLDEEAKK